MNTHDRIRGAADVPLTDEGHKQVQSLGTNFAKNGPLDIVISSDLSRTSDTAHAVSNGAPVIITPHLRDMDYGKFTGMPSHIAIGSINKAITTTPNDPVDGAQGESFNHYRDRLTGIVKMALQASNAYPQARIGLVVNRRSIKTIKAWLSNGKTDNAFNMPEAISADPGLKPADIFHLSGRSEGKYSVDKVDSEQALKPGIYLIRHGLTPWNGESYKDDGTPKHASQAALDPAQANVAPPQIRGINDMIKNASTTTQS